VAALFVVIALPSPAWAARDDTLLVSRASGAEGAKGNGYRAAISGDGRFVAFESTALNIHPDAGAPPFVRDIVVRDLQTDATTLASRASGPAGAVANGNSFSPVISADGRFVAFASTATNLHPDDGDGVSDVFVRDLQTNTTVLVSRGSGAGGEKGHGHSPSISADGRFVAFTSAAPNLHPDDPDGADDVFVRDLQTETTILVSRGPGGAAANNELASFTPASISADGRFVAFSSTASNLHPADTGQDRDVFVRDIQANTTELVSLASGANVTGHSDRFAISADGRFVVFTREIFTRVTFRTDVLRRDLVAGKTVLVGRASGRAGARGYGSHSGSISANGRLVAFASGGAHLHPHDTDGLPDIFVRDLRTHTTTLASRATGRTGPNGVGGSHDPSLSADGRFVAFESRSQNLHPDDTDRSGDIFVRELGALPLRRPPRVFCQGRRATVVLVPGTGPVTGTADPDVIVGTRGADTVDGSTGRDLICGRGGRDRLAGRKDNDRIFGESGNDRLFGESGHDRLSGGAGRDLLNCGPGEDRARADRLDRTRRCELP
jgi:Tol biopolymer transport system component